MRIVIDARYLSSQISGIGNYSRNLLEHIARLDSENSYRVLVHASFNGAIVLARNFELAYVNARPLSLKTLTNIGRIVRGAKPDLFHALCPVTPPNYTDPMVVTVHDLQPLMMPEWSGGRHPLVQKAYQRFYHWMYPSTFERAERLITVSDTTRCILGERYPQFAAKTMAIPSGFAPDPPPPDPELIWSTLQFKYGIPERFILYVGSTRPNKNLDRMLEAFSRARRNNPALDDVAFLLALTPDRFLAAIEDKIDALKLRQHVRILKHVPTPQRNVLLARARLLFFVTRLEGFGFPILEAQAADCPVLTSTSDASPEVAGGGAMLVDWVDIDQQARALEQLLLDAPLRARLVAAGRENLARFQWEETARKTLLVYYETTGTPPPDRLLAKNLATS